MGEPFLIRTAGLTENIGDEDAMEFGGLEKLSQFNPMVDIVESMRLVFGVAP